MADNACKKKKKKHYQFRKFTPSSKIVLGYACVRARIYPRSVVVRSDANAGNVPYLSGRLLCAAYADRYDLTISLIVLVLHSDMA